MGLPAAGFQCHACSSYKAEMVIVAASSWQAEIDECLSQSQEEIQQLEDAEACRSSSSDIEDDQLGPVFLLGSTSSRSLQSSLTRPTSAKTQQNEH